MIGNGARPPVRGPARVAPVHIHSRSAGAPRSVVVAAIANAPAGPAAERIDSAVIEFSGITDVKARLQHLVELGRALPTFPEASKTRSNQVMGCTSQVWLTLDRATDGAVSIAADSDSEVSRGLAAVLVRTFSGLTAREIAAVDPDFLARLDLGPVLAAPSRSNAFRNMFESIKKRARALEGDLPRFPSLLITPDSLTPQGAFAEAQAAYLQPDASQIDRLATVLEQKKIGVVAHFYMDPEVQGVLTSAAARWPHIAISDSLVMADKAVKMAESGCKYICVLGVDFMSENVRAILDEAGHQDVQVFRMASDDIGCSLAEAAESDAYVQYLDTASEQPNSMHVIYINTSLRTKAVANARVPTITCTSSNVVQTVLQGFAEVPGMHVWYGPDTYMGRNLQQLFESLAELPDEDVQRLHPAHTAASVRDLLPRLHHFQEGTCIVHHIFGGETCDIVRSAYADAYITAHFEVPGEMFTLAMEAQRARGMGVVGSTSNILDFITEKVSAAVERGFADTVQIVLGTEAGMITSIVRRVQSLLAEAPESGVHVEIVFPVAPESITTEAQATGVAAPVTLPGGLAVVPGPAAGEGCSLEGGCASCPYMKMNSLNALLHVCERCGTAGEATLEGYRPKAYSEQIDGMSLAKAGCKPILNMRHFQTSKKFAPDFVQDIVTRNA